MEILESTTLAEAVDTWPQLAREFERRGLDYCCGGQRSLYEACEASGLDATVVVEELGEAVASQNPMSVHADWSAMTAEALVDHIEATHHRYLWTELPRVTRLLDKIIEVHGRRHPELREIAACFAQVRDDLEPHMLKEERVLFPMIRDLASTTGPTAFHCGSLRNPIGAMLSEHDAVGELLAHLHRLTDGYTEPPDGCATYMACFAAMAAIEADTHLHIHKENNVLFPLVLRLEMDANRPDPADPLDRSI